MTPVLTKGKLPFNKAAAKVANAGQSCLLLLQLLLTQHPLTFAAHVFLHRNHVHHIGHSRGANVAPTETAFSQRLSSAMEELNEAEVGTFLTHVRLLLRQMPQ